MKSPRQQPMQVASLPATVYPQNITAIWNARNAQEAQTPPTIGSHYEQAAPVRAQSSGRDSTVYPQNTTVCPQNAAAIWNAQNTLEAHTPQIIAAQFSGRDHEPLLTANECLHYGLPKGARWKTGHVSGSVGPSYIKYERTALDDVGRTWQA